MRAGRCRLPKVFSKREKSSWKDEYEIARYIFARDPALPCNLIVPEGSCSEFFKSYNRQIPLIKVSPSQRRMLWVRRIQSGSSHPLVLWLRFVWHVYAAPAPDCISLGTRS